MYVILDLFQNPITRITRAYKLNLMIAVLTGDIINSQEHEVSDWLTTLKEILNFYGKAPNQWEVFRGDSFQLSLKPEIALLAALHIKATIKQIKNLDVRIAIGLGEENYSSQNITESNGTAYINSGKCFEKLQKQTLAIATGNTRFDELINLMLNLGALTTNNWTPTVAEAIKTAIEHPEKNQKELAKLLNKSQSNVSELLKRGGVDEILKLNSYYKQYIPN